MNWRHPDALIQIFARPPAPGQVKTRLIPALGARGAAELHVRLLRRTVAMALGARLAPVQLWCASEVDHPVFVETGLPRRRQRGPDLGARMAAALAQGLREARRVVLIGSDCPAMAAAYLEAALAALAEHDAVLGPAEDGGYVLIGLRRMADLFTGVAWGTARVLEQTRARLADAGLTWQELDPLWDVDRPADLARLSRLGEARM